MNFNCHSCNKRYQIADEKVLGKTVKIRCKECQAIITVTGPELPEEDRTRVVSVDAQGRIIGAGAPSPAASTAPPPARDPWDDEPTRAAPPLDPRAQWFAMIGGKQVGPLHGRSLIDRLASGDITLRTHLWKDGMADWKRAEEIPELAALLGGGGNASPPGSAPAQAPVPAPRIAPVQVPPVQVAPVQAAPAPAPAPAPRRQRRQPAPELDLATEPQPEPEPNPGSPLSSDLFNDVDLQAHRSDGEQELSIENPEKPTGRRKALGTRPVAASSESTDALLAEAGISRRNPAWKIALAVVLFLAIPVGVLYALSELNVVPLQVTTRVDSSGKEVKQSVFTAEGATGLKNVLLGNAPRQDPPAPRPKPAAANSPAAGSASAAAPANAAHAPSQPRSDDAARGGSAGAVAKADSPAPSAENQKLASLYGEASQKADVGPTARKPAATADSEPAASTPSQSGADSASDGPSPQEVSKVVSQSQTAFRVCIEQELRRNPRFRGGKINILASVAPAGTVKRVSIDRHDIDATELGDCIKTRAKRMVFTAFQGDDVDLEIPLILSKTM